MKEMKLEAIADVENQFVAGAAEEFGEYYAHAQFAIDLLHSWLKSASYEAVFFTMFFSLVEKHIILGALSAIRLHHVQANFDFRYATEAAAWAAFALANPDPALFGEQKEQGFDPTDKAKKNMHAWLEANYPAGNESLKRFKGAMNELSTHANIVDAHRNFSGMTREKMNTSFFDELHDHHVKTDLWTTANLAMGALDLFYGVNRDYPVLVLQDDFLSRMDTLRRRDTELKDEMKKNPNFARFSEQQA
jgi:hypothetical protein